MPSAAAPLARSWSRLDGVDLLRGLAILFVLANHVNMRLLGAHILYLKRLPLQLASSLVWNGQQGVQIFFCVSGFLITATTLRRWPSLSQISVRRFYQLRFARIAPLLLLLLLALSLLHLARVPGFIVSQETGGLGRALLAAFTFHINLLEARRGYLPPSWDILWSLSVEEIFYLFFPLACRLSRRSRYLAAPLLLFVVLGPFARSRAFNPNPVWREYSYLGGMDAIALGCLTALLLAARRLSRRVLWTSGALGTALLLLTLCLSDRVYRWGLGRNGLGMTLLGLGTCLLIAVFAETGWKAPRLLTPLLRLGQRSYEVYLTHVFLVLALFALFVHFGQRLSAVPVLFLVTVLAASLLGEGVARLYSEPLNQWLRRRWGDQPARLGSVVPVPDAP